MENFQQNAFKQILEISLTISKKLSLEYFSTKLRLSSSTFRKGRGMGITLLIIKIHNSANKVPLLKK